MVNQQLTEDFKAFCADFIFIELFMGKFWQPIWLSDFLEYMPEMIWLWLNLLIPKTLRGALQYIV